MTQKYGRLLAPPQHLDIVLVGMIVAIMAYNHTDRLHLSCIGLACLSHSNLAPEASRFFVFVFDASLLIHPLFVLDIYIYNI